MFFEEVLKAEFLIFQKLKKNYWSQDILAKHFTVVRFAYFAEKFHAKSFTQPSASKNFPFTVC